MKTSKIIPNCTFIFFSSHCVVLFLWEHQQVEWVQSTYGGSLRYEIIGQIQNWCYSQRGEPRLLLEYIFVGHSWNLLKLYPIVHSYFFFFSLHCIVLFPLRAPASWRSAKCTLRLFKVWKNWPNSKLICYSGRGEPTRLSFEYKFVGHSLKIYKILPNRRFIFICWSSHCVVLFPLRAPASWRRAKCTLRLFKVWRNRPNSKLIVNSERGEPRLSFEYKFVGHSLKIYKILPNRRFIFMFWSSHCVVLFPLSKLKESKVHTEAL